MRETYLSKELTSEAHLLLLSQMVLSMVAMKTPLR